MSYAKAHRLLCAHGGADNRTARTEKRAKKEIERVFVTADAGFLIPQQA